MTFAKEDWTLTPSDIEQLDAISLNTSLYHSTSIGVESHIPTPTIVVGDGNLNQVDSIKPMNIKGMGAESEESSYSGTNPSKVASGSQPINGVGMGTATPLPLPVSGRFYTVDQLSVLPEPKWLIDRLLPEDALMMVAGLPKSLKSFLAIDWMLHLAIGREWNGRDVEYKEGMAVLYMLGEGKNNLKKRVDAWILHYKPTPVELDRLKRNFYTTFDMSQLSIKSSVDTLIKDMNNAGIHPKFIVVDTFARAMVGKNENAVEEMGVAIAQMDRLRALGHTVMFIHHMDKKGRQFRGSGSLEAAIDTSFDVKRNWDNDEITVANSNQKDEEESKDMKFGFKKIFVDGLDQRVSSIVLTPMTEIPIKDQILQLSLPLSRTDVLKMVKGVRKETVIEVLDDMLANGVVVEKKDGRFKMIDHPSNNPNVG